MRNPFVAVEAGTDLRARARVLRRSWESAMGGDTNCDVRPVVERSWRRLASAGIDPDRLEPRRAIDHAELDYVRASSPLSHVIAVLRSPRALR